MNGMIFAVLLAVPFSAAFAQDKPLSPDEIRALVTGKIMDFPEDARGITRQLKIDAGGTGIFSSRSYGKQSPLSAPLKWQINDKGELCTHVQQAGHTEICTLVQKSQDASYARVQDGKVRATFNVR